MRSLLTSIGMLAVACSSGSPRATAPAPIGSSGPSAPERGAPAATASLAIALTSDSVAINGTPIGPRPVVADLEAVLGAPDRTLELHNDIHVYDRLGLAVYEAGADLPAAGRVIQLSIFFGREPEYPFMPASLFTGVLTFDGKAVPPDATLPGIKSMFPAAAFDPDMDEYTLSVRGENVWFSHVGDGDGLLQVAISFDDE